MSESWSGGKGDKSRVNDYDKYRANHDRIFNKPKKPSYKLFLDDYRNPKNAFLWDINCSMLKASSTYSWDWEVVRSYKSFVDIIEKRGIPEMVSFDNDLNDKHMDAYMEACHVGEYNWENLKETGIHCALYLKQKCEDLGEPFPKFFVHSANHFARKIISELIHGN